MKLLTTKDFKQLGNYDPSISSILRYNGINEKNLFENLPDYKYEYTFQEYFNIMERNSMENEFVNFIDSLDPDKDMIGIVGDKDGDGIMATTILTIGLTMLGYKVTYTIPDRFLDGYGMKIKHVDILRNSGANVIMTVDNGITTFDAIDYAKKLGMKVLITDHHNPTDTPNADLIIDPYFNNDKFKDISGATVVFKLIYHLFEVKNIGFDNGLIEDLAMLAGITEISDVMPMIGENRILYKATMTYMNKNAKDTNSLTFKLGQLLSFTKNEYMSDYVKQLKNFNKTTMDFYFVPVINSVSRVYGDATSLATDIIYLFWDNKPIDSEYYGNINEERKKMKKELLEEYADQSSNDESHIVVEALNSHSLENYSGIAGLVASTIVEEERKPALIGVLNNSDTVAFSGRSLSGFSLFDSLQRVKEKYPELRLNFGGHDEALGGSINLKDIDLLRKYLSEDFSENYIEKEEVYFNLDNMDKWIPIYMRLLPFGNKFEFPKFYAKKKILFCNFQDRWFKLKFCGNSEIKCFSITDLKYMMALKKKNNESEIEVVLEMYSDENGKVGFKLVNILNRDLEIYNSIKNEYKEKEKK